MNDRFLGQVSWSPNAQAVYVRVSVPLKGDRGSLAIKATFRGFSRRCLTKGVWVTVSKTDPKDHRRYCVMDILDREPPVSFDMGAMNSNRLGFDDSEDNVAAKSDIRPVIKFCIPASRFENVTEGVGLAGVLSQAFDIRYAEVLRHKQTRHCRGMIILCRPDQFAMFLIYRNDKGLTNGFKELHPEIVHLNERRNDAYDSLAEKVGITREQAKLAALMLNFSTAAAVAQAAEWVNSEINVTTRSVSQLFS